MHVLMISSRSDLGGGPKHLYDLCQGLKLLDNSINITIASPQDAPFYEKFLDIADFHVKIPQRSFSVKAYFKLLAYSKNNSVSLIHSHGRGAGIYSRLLALFGFKLVHTFHGAHVESSLVGKIKSFIDLFLSRVKQKNICVSHDEKKQILQLNWALNENVSIIHNGVDIKSLQKEFLKFSKDEARDIFKLPKDKIIWGTLARLNYQKGLDLLLSNSFLPQLPVNYLLTVAGGGEEKEKIQSYLEKNSIQNVKFLGETQTPYLYLRCLDGYFSYSRWEGFPLSVLEALGLGLPCLLSDVVGHGDFKGKVEFFNHFNGLEFIHAIQQNKESYKGEFTFTLEEMSRSVLNIYKSLS